MSDDVVVDGRIITAENFDSSSLAVSDELTMADEGEGAAIASHGYIRVKKLNSGG